MSSYLVYNRTTGAIVSTGSGGDPWVQATDRPGMASIPGTADQKTEYVDLSNESIVPKRPATFDVDKTTVLADNTDEVQLLGVLIDDDVSIYHEGRRIASFAYTLDDASLTFDEDGEYKIHVRSPQLLEHEVIINAT